MTMTTKIGMHPAADEVEDVRHGRSSPSARSSPTMSPLPATPITRAVVPTATSVDAVALYSWVWPSFLTRTLP